MVHRSVPALAIAWLWVILLVISTVSGSGCGIQREDSILAPVGPLPPPVVNLGEPADLHGVLLYILADPAPGAFRLGAVGEDEPAFCAGGNNCFHLPDFNVAFYQLGEPLDSQVGQIYNGFGPEEGTVPADADYALVWLASGGLNEDFVFEQECE